MKKIIIGGLILLLGSSCLTQKRCLERFPPQILTKDSIILKDTTIYIPVKIKVPGDSVHLIDTIPCPDVEYHKEVKSPSGKSTATVDIHKSVLSVDCKTDSLERTIDSLAARVKVAEAYHSQVQIVEKPITKYRSPIWAWLLLAGVILYIFRNPLLKLLKI